MAGKICPNCGKRYKGLEVYCTKCGIELEKDKERCSELGGEQEERNHVRELQTVD